MDLGFRRGDAGQQLESSTMPTPIADRWFERQTVEDGVTLLWEPHVHRLLRCNIWHIRGRERDMLVDTGLGVASLATAARDLFEKKLAAVATHTHLDHSGGMHEFAERLVHRAEGARLAEGDAKASLIPADRGRDYVENLTKAGFVIPDEYIDHYPHAGYDVRAYAVRPAPATRLLEEGDRIDLGDRNFEVLHIPGHSPGSIGLWEAATGTLFSGDAIYDGVLLDDLPGSNIPDYVRSMRRLRELPVRVVHGGHRPSFGRERLVELVDAYLAKRAGTPMPRLA
jgi:glyoxylase-like metal-dependent hydrolase (beta-lactamase superfamily II)